MKKLYSFWKSPQLRMTLIGFFLLLLFPFTSEAQYWIELSAKENLNIYELQEKVEEHYANRDKGKGSGYKQWKRWEFQMLQKVDKKGNVITPVDVLREQKSFQKKSSARKSLASTWKEVGPQSWRRTSAWGGGIGRITSIALHPSNPETIYVTSPGGGLWRSDTGGGNWTPLSDKLANLEMYSVAIAPSNPSVIYVGGVEGAVYRSSDQGNTLTEVGAANGVLGRITKIIVHPTNENIALIAAFGDGCYKTEDGGVTWKKVIYSYVEDLEFHPSDPSIIYASGGEAYRSTDGGESFSLMVISNTRFVRTMLAICEGAPNVVYIIQADGREFGAIFRSDDAGVNFEKRAFNNGVNTNYFGYETSGTGTGGQAWYDMAITVNPENPDEVHIGGITCWKSIDGAQTFQPTTQWILQDDMDYGYNHPDMHSLIYSDGVIYSGSDGGIYKSIDGGINWIDLSKGLGIRQFYRIANSVTDPEMCVGRAQDNGTSVRKNGEWIEWLGADGTECLVDHTDHNILYGTSQYGAIYTSKDGGETYSDLYTNPTNGNWITPIAMDANVSTTLYAGFKSLLRSTDAGLNWNQISEELYSNIDVIALASSNSTTIYFSDRNKLYRSYNSGETWEIIFFPSVITDIAVDPENDRKVAFALNSSIKANQIVLSENGGDDWISYGENLPGFNVICLEYQRGSKDGLYIGMLDGVYYRNNTMSQWIKYGKDLPNVPVNEIEIQEEIGKIRVATYGRGLWEVDAVKDLVLPIANFDQINFTIDAGDTVSFTNQSRFADSYVWFFEGGNLLQSNEVNPSIRYDVPGEYPVMLVAINEFSKDTLIQNAKVHVLGPVYCIPEISVTHNHIARVRLNDIDNSSTVNADNAHSHYRYLSTELAQGSQQTVRVNLDKDDGYWYGNRVQIWLDANQNDVFESNERVYSNYKAGEHIATFRVPEDAVPGRSALRIKYSWYDEKEACEKDEYGGEVEDYSVVILRARSYCHTRVVAKAHNYIKNVSVNTINNESTVDLQNAHSDFRHLSTKLWKDSVYDISVDLEEEGWEGSRIQIWLDMNLDQEYQDSERIYNEMGLSQNDFSFTVPSDLDTGVTGMRVRFSWYDEHKPCATEIVMGEVEDYTIYIDKPYPPKAKIEHFPKEIFQFDETQFIDATINGSTNREWQFLGPDSLVTTQKDPIIKFKTEGVYQVILTVENEDGADADTTIVKVNKNFCEAYSTLNALCFDEFITEVNLSEDSSIVYLNESDCKAYTDHTNDPSSTIVLEPGKTYDMEVHIGVLFSQEFVNVWIDWNRDTIFDESEKTALLYKKILGMSYGKLSIPEDVDGDYLLRTRLTFYEKANQSCGESEWGEVEDFNLTISPNVAKRPLIVASKVAIDVAVYPNPTNGMFTVEIPESMNGGTILIRSLQGKTIHYQKVNGHLNRVDLEGVAKGTYLLSIAKNGKLINKKIVLQ